MGLDRFWEGLLDEQQASVAWSGVAAVLAIKLKSALSIRPLFHRLEPRVGAHILVAFLGYALWVTLKHLLQSVLTSARVLALLSTVQSADIVLPTTDGREIQLRRVPTRCCEQRKVLKLLGVSLAERLDSNFDCSVNSAAV